MAINKEYLFLARQNERWQRRNLSRAMALAVMFFAALVFVARGQTNLSDTGKLSDLNGKTKIYLIADGDHRKAILKTLEKQKAFALVDRADDAEFFVEYKTISRQQFGLGGQTETGQIDAYFNRDGRKVIAWTDSTTGGGFGGDTAKRLIKKFFKELDKA